LISPTIDRDQAGLSGSGQFAAGYPSPRGNCAPPPQVVPSTTINVGQG
jgi:hypothetical protein